MASIEQVRNVVKKIASTDIGTHICFFGGSIPYIMMGCNSNREHSDIDILVDEAYMEIVRCLLQEHNLYIDTKDSLNFNVDKDYGLKAYVDGVYVEFEPMKIVNNRLYRRSFSPNSEMVGEEVIEFDQITDLIIPVQVEGINTYFQSMEYIKVQKEKYQRDKDIKDVQFINKCGFDVEKYNRVKMSFDNSYQELQKYSFDEIGGIDR
ncbi:MAG: hypothetical protein E7168_02665 [Firmicutes bacterium]|nr:hypothetical protein [Bacillota bacterium]